jgi:transcriptional regulator with XRE-family HTH domain
MGKGDPKGGRPAKTLTDEQRPQLEALAGLLTQDQIADYFGMSRPTLAAIMRRDEDVSLRYKRGKAKRIAKVASKAFEAALKGTTADRAFYLKTQAGWRETNHVDHTSSDGSMTPKGVPEDVITALDAIAGKIASSDGAG